MIIRALIWIALAVIAYKLIRRLVPKRPQNKTKASSETMVKCQHCGIHIPHSQAIQENDQTYFCSTAHLQAFKDNQPK